MPHPAMLKDESIIFKDFFFFHRLPLISDPGLHKLINIKVDDGNHVRTNC